MQSSIPGKRPAILSILEYDSFVNQSTWSTHYLERTASKWIDRLCRFWNERDSPVHSLFPRISYSIHLLVLVLCSFCLRNWKVPGRKVTTEYSGKLLLTSSRHRHRLNFAITLVSIPSHSRFGCYHLRWVFCLRFIIAFNPFRAVSHSIPVCLRYVLPPWFLIGSLISFPLQ